MCAHAKRDRKNFNSYVSKDQTLAIASHQLTLMLAACFFRRFLDSVQAAGGLFLHIPTGNARSQQAARRRCHSSMCARAALAQRYVCCVLHEAAPFLYYQGRVISWSNQAGVKSLLNEITCMISALEAE